MIIIIFIVRRGGMVTTIKMIITRGMGIFFLNSFPDLLPPFTTKPDPGKNKNFPVSTRRRLERLKCLHVQYSCAVRYNLHCMGVTNCRMVSPETLTTIFSTVLVRVLFLL